MADKRDTSQNETDKPSEIRLARPEQNAGGGIRPVDAEGDAPVEIRQVNKLADAASPKRTQKADSDTPSEIRLVRDAKIYQMSDNYDRGDTVFHEIWEDYGKVVEHTPGPRVINIGPRGTYVVGNATTAAHAVVNFERVGRKTLGCNVPLSDTREQKQTVVTNMSEIRRAS